MLEIILIGTPYDWNGNNYPSYGYLWGRDNLYDGEIAYTSNVQGGTNCTGFNALSSVNSGCWTRFIVDLGSAKEMDSIKIAIGNSESRIPKSVSVYMIPESKYVTGTDTNSTYNENLVLRKNDNLILLHTEEFTSTFTTPTWFEFVKE